MKNAYKLFSATTLTWDRKTKGGWNLNARVNVRIKNRIRIFTEYLLVKDRCYFTGPISGAPCFDFHAISRMSYRISSVWIDI